MITNERRLIVSTDQRLVGTLREKNDLWAFDYDQAWASDKETYDLSPALPRSSGTIADGASVRPVQWYFDNLLPEEQLRALLAAEAKTPPEDAFGLLAILGKESAGSLTLRDPTDTRTLEKGLRPLSLHDLSQRIVSLPSASMSRDAPKRMSLAGAQHKLLVVFANGELYEPLGGTPSSHILKPDHPEPEYPGSVANEYFTMRLALECALNVPNVHRLYVPQPVYLVERFDRVINDAGKADITRLHAVDLCQLLNKPRLFKYSETSLTSLAQAIERCRARAIARTQLFRWVAFNAVVGNSDNHLKNVSFLVDHRGIDLAPAYDLLSTAAYATRALAGEAVASWPQTTLTLPLAAAGSFAEVTRDALVGAGTALGLARSTSVRILDELVARIRDRLDPLLGEIEAEAVRSANESPDPQQSAMHVANEMRVLRTIRHVIVHDMLDRIAG